MIIKVCGMRDAENIREVERSGIDMMGFICWEPSPRFVAEVPAWLPGCPRIGVFVDPSPLYIQRQAEAFGFSLIQLHGSESPDFCQRVREEMKLPVIKAISIREAEDIGLTGRYEGACDMFLFDTKCATRGGSGLQFNWDILHGYRGGTPFLLSGGIGPEDVGALRQFHHPLCLGIDINSRFEVEPGIKDVDKIKTFINAIKKHEPH